MKSGRIQAKDIDEAPILEFLRAHDDEWSTHWSTKAYPEPRMPSLVDSIPGLADVPQKVLLAKLGSMVRRGLISGCGCGCRGDWEIRSRPQVSAR